MKTSSYLAKRPRRSGAAARRGLLLVATFAVVALLAAVVVGFTYQIQYRAQQTGRVHANAQADLAALAVMSAPRSLDSLTLPNERVVSVEADRVVLRTRAGRAIAAARIDERVSGTAEKLEQ